MKYFALIVTLLVLQLQLFSQVAITGSVKDATTGDPLPGASVNVQGTSIGTIANFSGNFSLYIPSDADKLIVSFVGYKTQNITIGDVTDFKIMLEIDAEEIGEVVVTALGIKREKKSLGYAVQDVQGDEMSEADPQNLVAALSGRIAGAQVTTASGQVGASTTIKIRGNKSFTGSASPLFVVDGTPILNTTTTARTTASYTDFGNAAMDIDPSNIENISILKGPSATALYGSRGANGVILITTKKGSMRKGLGVQFSSSLAFDEVYILPNYQNEYGQGFDGSEFHFERVKELMKNPDLTYQEYHDLFGFRWATDGTGKSATADESWGSRLDVGLLVPQYDSPLDEDGNPIPTPWISHPDNVKNFYETGITSVSSLALISQTDRSSSRFTIGYTNQKGTSPNTDQKKINLGLNTSYELSEKLSVDININYINLVNDNLPQLGNSMRNPLLEFNGWFGRQVDLEYSKEHYEDIILYEGEPKAFNWMMGYPSQHPNPYWNAYKNTMSRDRNRIYGNAAITYNILQGVDLVARVGTDTYSEQRKFIYHQYSRDWTDMYENATNGNFWEQMRSESETNADIMLEINRNLSDDITLFGFVGASYTDSYSRFATTSGYNLVVPDFFSTSNYEGDFDVSFTRYRRVTESVFGAANFGFRNYLFLDMTLRNDWSSVLPQETWSFSYPSINLGFIFSDAFNLQSDFFNYGKLRAGYAIVGDADNLSTYALDPVFLSIGTPFNGVNLFRTDRTLPSSILEPEMTYSYEIGGEFKFLGNRLGLDIAYYNALTKNQLLDVSMAPSTGFLEWSMNAGSIRNYGVEIQTYATPIKTTSFSWDVNVNWSTNKNTIEELTEGLTELQITSYSMYDNTLMAFPGEEWGAIYGTTFARNENGDILVTGNGMPYESSEFEILGYVNPDWVGGVNNTFAFKGISFSFLIDFRKGGDVFSYTKAIGQKTGILQSTVEGGIRETGMIVPGVYDEGAKADLDGDGKKEDVSGLPNQTPVAASRYWGDSRSWSELSILDGSYVKLREMVMNIAIPKRLTEKLKVQNASLSLFGRNLALLYTHESNDVHIDPEVSTGGTISGTGLEQYQLAPSRTLGVKLNVNF